MARKNKTDFWNNHPQVKWKGSFAWLLLHYNYLYLYLPVFDNSADLRYGLKNWFRFYNLERSINPWRTKHRMRFTITSRYPRLPDVLEGNKWTHSLWPCSGCPNNGVHPPLTGSLSRNKLPRSMKNEFFHPRANIRIYPVPVISRLCCGKLFYG